MPALSMPTLAMQLKILLPSRVFADVKGVSRVVAETREGAFGLLPRRLDCVAAITCGILTYETAQEGEVYVAIDEGVLVKTGPHVRVSVRRAIAGDDLDQLRQAVEHEFRTRDANEQNVRSVMAKLESGFLHRFASLQHGHRN